MKLKSLLSTALILTLFAAPAFAITDTESGYSDGTQKSYVKGTLTLTNGTNDTAKATTESDLTAGTISVNAVLHYTLAVGGADTLDDYQAKSEAKSVSSNTLTAPNAFGSSGNGGHGFTSPYYGSWYGGTQASF